MRFGWWNANWALPDAPCLMMDAQTLKPFRFQYAMGRALIFITIPLMVLAVKLAGYRVRDLKQVRRNVKTLMNRHPGPWLICANHLTLIDSVILAYAMMPPYQYMLRFRLLPWNIPEHMNFNRNPALRAVCFLAKCIPVVRGGDRGRVKSSLEKCLFVLGRGEPLMIFPEGTRSRTGRVNTNDFPYGVGRLACTVPGCRVMCVYLRGDGQDTYSDFPRRGETFTMTVKECLSKTALSGLRAQRDCASRIIGCLNQMENDYFKRRG